MGLWRIELFFDVGIQVLCPIYLPDTPRREWNQGLKEEQEGGEWILFDFVPRFPPPIPGSGVERPNGLLGKDGHEAFRLPVAVVDIPG